MFEETKKIIIEKYKKDTIFYFNQNYLGLISK